MLLDVSNVRIAYGGTPVVKDVSLSLSPGSIGCLLGSSGCGKTTLLRAIAGFEPLLAGEITLKGNQVSCPGHVLEPEKRKVGMVFQDLALFPHLNIADNIGFGLRRYDQHERRKRVAELLQLVGLEHAEKTYPHQLSGGQQQRVALARTMAPRPDLLLLDEPFSSLDADLRGKLAQDVRQILKQDGLTALLVTHDQTEAFAIADEIGVMNSGQILQWDNAHTLYHYPSHRFVAEFIGHGVTIPGVVCSGGSVRTILGVSRATVHPEMEEGTTVEILLRPENILHNDTSPCKAKITAKYFRGADYMYSLELSGGTSLLYLAPSSYNLEVGHVIGICTSGQSLAVLPVR